MFLLTPKYDIIEWENDMQLREVTRLWRSIQVEIALPLVVKVVKNPPLIYM